MNPLPPVYDWIYDLRPLRPALVAQLGTALLPPPRYVNLRGGLESSGAVKRALSALKSGSMPFAVRPLTRHIAHLRSS